MPDTLTHTPAKLISDAEWQVRKDLAAFYRLSAIYGWDDLIYTHISARVPGPDHHFLINPFGLTFDEITASSLVKVDLDGNLIGEHAYGINYAGYVIHSAIHAARDDAHFVAHFHSPDGTAVSAHKEGILPLNQRALSLIPRLSYHDYEGVALNLDERERLVADLGDTKVMLLRNHGTLALGAHVGEAWSNIYHLESACTAQVRTLSIGRDNILIAPEEAQEEVKRQMSSRSGVGTPGAKSHYDLVWEASLRKVDRLLPGYDQ
ncbi:class II aldolase/adducin family protein [Asticcacaulis sp. BYS171W]|uniref:Class II aldolase/adducin family protein n=1 Tax=Asticcacaulis aquaticus TaxID=2984212 RepID=A0ABT5HV93_9CAUL|nr:class II aldolase/adducin family protein [Asticcacaulis aquaticus]MDC7683765.1 class II aldolase/adducin family protein [Asticcacaulis aquaticus]